MFLKTVFNETEEKILQNFGREVKVFYSIDEKKLFFETVSSGEVQYSLVENPNRILEIDGYLLMEEKNYEGSWNMGSFKQEKGYVFIIL